MIYRVYISGTRGYEQVGKDIKKKHLLKILDNIMATITNERVLVIAHNIEHNYDEPIFLNVIQNYDEFKNKYKSRKKVKHDKSDDKIKRY